MHKLVDAFTANPNVANALRLLKYVEKHPMTACIFGDVIDRAEKVAGK